MQFPVTIGLHRSFLLSALVLTLHLAALGVALLVLPQTRLSENLPWGLSLLLLMSAWRSWRVLDPAVSALRLGRNGRIECRRRGDGAWREARLLVGATVHPALIVLPLQIDGKTCRLALTRGSAGPEELRRLRVWLRWQPQTINSSDDAA